MSAWHETAEAQALLRLILAERPGHWFLPRYGMIDTRYPKFKGENARKLRALWQARIDGAVERSDHELFRALHETHPDDLIDAVLNHRVEISDGKLAA